MRELTVHQRILGGDFDFAVRARATWLWQQDGYLPEEENLSDLSRYEAMCDEKIQKRWEAHHRRLRLAAFANVMGEL